MVSMLDEPEAPIPIGWLLQVLQARPRSQQDRGELPPDLSTRLFHAALHGTPFPRQMVVRALARLRLPPDRDAFVPGGTATALRLRCALIKATINRQHINNKDWRPITVSLDENNRNVAYVLGRLFALLEIAQAESVGKDRDVNATIRDRYFGAASSTPGLVFPTLLERFNHHAAKLRKDNKPWRDREVEEVISLLPSASFPRTLELQEQGLFAIGYYHQRANDRRKAAEGAAAKKVRKAAEQVPAGEAQSVEEASAITTAVPEA